MEHSAQERERQRDWKTKKCTTHTSKMIEWINIETRNSFDKEADRQTFREK